MIDRASLRQALENIGAGGRWPAIDALLDRKLAPHAHGDLQRWQSVLAEITQLAGSDFELPRCRELLIALGPWRKGPFRLRGIEIDAEWRSDLKWRRVVEAASPFRNRVVLDVGCGNGFYAREMRLAGAGTVIGVDPTLLYLVQFLAVQALDPVDAVYVLPLRLEELPAGNPIFDTVASMGVLYHRREPLDHLRSLRASLRPGGELILETLILPGGHHQIVEPEGRYARMRNVWHLPTLPALESWLSEAGFVNCRIADVSATTTGEQRTTEWMTFESLQQALDPTNRAQTVEGLPAPTRALLIGTAPTDNTA